jgi:type I restriction enzyme R subunit
VTPRDFSERGLVEKPTLALLSQLGYETADGYTELLGADHAFAGGLGRDDQSQVVLHHRLRPKLPRLNPDVPAAGIEAAIDELTLDRSAMDPTRANQAVWKLLRDGAKVTVADDRGDRETKTVRFIDWRTPANNEFFAVHQLWVVGPLHTRRCDIVCFVNGIPLMLLELKASHKSVEQAYSKNLRDYRDAIPQLFTPNGLIVLSNGSERAWARRSRLGSGSASGRGSTTSPSPASSRSRRRSTGYASRSVCSTRSRTSSPISSGRAG